MLKRVWERKLTPEELPEKVRDHIVYQGGDWWMEAIRISDDGRYIGIWFNDTPIVGVSSHLWRRVKDTDDWTLVGSVTT